MAAKICWLSIGARPSEGSSSSSSRGRLISARPIASICCSPPDSVPPRWAARSLRRGNSRNTRSMSASKCDWSVIVAPICRFSSTVMRAKDAAAFRRLGDAQVCDLVRRQAGDVAAVEHDAALARARIAEDGHHQRRLAGAIGADQGDDLAGMDVEIDAFERDDVAVIGLHAAHREQGLGRCAAGAMGGLTLIARPPRALRRFPRLPRRDRRRSPWDRCAPPAACRRRS